MFVYKEKIARLREIYLPKYKKYFIPLGLTFAFVIVLVCILANQRPYKNLNDSLSVNTPAYRQETPESIPPITPSPSIAVTPPVPSISPTPKPEETVKDQVIEVMIDDGTLYATDGDGYSYPNKAVILKKFYQSHPDIYDFISIYDDKTAGGPILHTDVSSNIEGIGNGVPFDQTEYYGSKGRLKGISTLNNLDTTELRYDMAYNAITHETAHHWMLHLKDTKLQKFQDNVFDLPHWNAYLDLDVIDPMGGSSAWKDNGDGTCTASKREGSRVFSWLSLYLMGLAKKEEVVEGTLVKVKGSEDRNNFVGYDFELNPTGTVDCSPVKVSAQDFIEAFGPRNPEYKNAQKDFTMAFIIVLRNSDKLSKDQKEKIVEIAKNFPDFWSKATRSRSTFNKVGIEVDYFVK